MGNFINDVGPGQGAPRTCTGPLNRGDYFGIEFDLTGADKKSLKYFVPLQGTTRVDCGQDGYQFHMTKKPTRNGKISSFYDPFGTDNRYELSEITNPKELLQASVFISRPNDRTFNWRVTDSGNNDVGAGTDMVMGSTGTFVIKDLRTTLTVGKTGPKGTQVTFEYGGILDVDQASWNSDDIGDGRGPGTDAGDPYSYCHQTTGVNNEWQTEYWFGTNLWRVSRCSLPLFSFSFQMPPSLFSPSFFFYSFLLFFPFSLLLFSPSEFSTSPQFSPHPLSLKSSKAFFFLSLALFLPPPPKKKKTSSSTRKHLSLISSACRCFSNYTIF